MTWKQKVTPNTNVLGYSGGCLAYVDDGVNPPQRQPTAQMSWQYAIDSKLAHPNEEPPLNVWVPVYYSINNGPWAGYGHVAWFYNDGTTIRIYDSEYGCGNRSAPYSSGAELFSYMGWQMSYLGWSESLDGLRIVEQAGDSKPTPKPDYNMEEDELIKLTVRADNKAGGTVGYLYNGAFIVGGSTGYYGTVYNKLKMMESQGLIKSIKSEISYGEYEALCKVFPSHKNKK
ncbi:hypothetical protein AAFF39_00355 [Lactococcus garvieae]